MLTSKETRQKQITIEEVVTTVSLDNYELLIILAEALSTKFKGPVKTSNIELYERCDEIICDLTFTPDERNLIKIPGEEDGA